MKGSKLKEYFESKQLKKISEKKNLFVYNWPNVSTYTLDSLLLANFTKINKRAKKIVELCGGNGAITFLLAADNREKFFDIVEIQEEVAKLSILGVEKNQFTNIQISIGNLKNCNEKIGFQKFDVVVVNPPFFKFNETSKLRKSIYQTIARHEIETTLEDIILEAKKLLKNRGSLNLIHRADRLQELFELINKHNLQAKRIKFIHTRKNKSAENFLIEIMKGSSPGVIIVEPPTYIYVENELSEEAKKLYE